ncbi:MAG: hypothetical protein MHPSP_000990 [Paramarteilia canceri]
MSWNPQRDSGILIIYGTKHGFSERKAAHFEFKIDVIDIEGSKIISENIYKEMILNFESNFLQFRGMEKTYGLNFLEPGNLKNALTTIRKIQKRSVLASLGVVDSQSSENKKIQVFTRHSQDSNSAFSNISRLKKSIKGTKPQPVEVETPVNFSVSSSVKHQASSALPPSLKAPPSSPPNKNNINTISKTSGPEKKSLPRPKQPSVQSSNVSPPPQKKTINTNLKPSNQSTKQTHSTLEKNKKVKKSQQNTDSDSSSLHKEIHTEKRSPPSYPPPPAASRKTPPQPINNLSIPKQKNIKTKPSIPPPPVSSANTEKKSTPPAPPVKENIEQSKPALQPARINLLSQIRGGTILKKPDKSPEQENEAKKPQSGGLFAQLTDQIQDLRENLPGKFLFIFILLEIITI